MKLYAAQLNTIAGRYRAAEKKVIAAFFRKPRARKDHARWLSAQAYKEYSAIKPIFTALAKLYPEVDRRIDRHDFEELTEKLADETKHARLLMDLLEEIKGQKVTVDDLLWLPEDRRLARIRARYSPTMATLLHGSGSLKARDIGRPDQAVEQAAITLTEGGGGALYLVCSQLPGNGFEKKIVSAFKQILADETKHKDSGGRSLTALIKNPRAFGRAAGIIHAVCAQRLRMRNEQFGFPLSQAEITSLMLSSRRGARPDRK